MRLAQAGLYRAYPQLTFLAPRAQKKHLPLWSIRSGESVNVGEIDTRSGHQFIEQ